MRGALLRLGKHGADIHAVVAEQAFDLLLELDRSLWRLPTAGPESHFADTVCEPHPPRSPGCP
jgi:hypothetical protein